MQYEALQPLPGVLLAVPLRLVPLVVAPCGLLERDTSGILEGLCLSLALAVRLGSPPVLKTARSSAASDSRCDQANRLCASQP